MLRAHVELFFFLFMQDESKVQGNLKWWLEAI
jgi:hypothetical protein